ncbi:hypothetical protein ABIE65_003805 [Constrictibacter sp. MBR-5]|jgi:hypothetical protein
MTTMRKDPSPAEPTPPIPSADVGQPIDDKDSRTRPSGASQGRDESAKVPRHDDPTRYGDWEIGGRCIDF